MKQAIRTVEQWKRMLGGSFAHRAATRVLAEMFGDKFSDADVEQLANAMQAFASLEQSG